MILDLFAAAGGWDEGARLAGYSGRLVGLELDHAACRTAVVAGHARIQCDVATYPVEVFAGKVDGLIASPPCQSWSSAGNQQGFDDPRGLLSHEPLRWATALRPRWVALEQVPEVLPHWRAVAYELRAAGYSTWTGVLCAADYGVPQTRERAILVARRDGPAATAPAATHSESGDASLFGDMPQWQSMADALGPLWPGRPARTVCGNRTQRWAYGQANSYGTGWTLMSAGRTGEGRPRGGDRPAATLTGKGTAVLVRGDESIHLGITETAVLQGFRADYPWSGTKTQRHTQIGNAIPPPLAAAILRPLLGELTRDAAA